MSYNPNQPRDPAGVPTGGQWTSGQLDTIGVAARKAAGLDPEDKEKYLSFGSLENWVGGTTENIVDGKYVFYHATIQKHVSLITEMGLKNPRSFSAKWFMTTSSLLEAWDMHATGINPVVIEFRIPISKVTEYLWPSMGKNSFGAIWHSPRKTIPSKYIFKIRKHK